MEDESCGGVGEAVEWDDEGGGRGVGLQVVEVASFFDKDLLCVGT